MSLLWYPARKWSGPINAITAPGPHGPNVITVQLHQCDSKNWNNTTSYHNEFNSQWKCRWWRQRQSFQLQLQKNYWNPSTNAKVIAKIKVAQFFHSNKYRVAQKVRARWLLMSIKRPKWFLANFSSVAFCFETRLSTSFSSTVQNSAATWRMITNQTLDFKKLQQQINIKMASLRENRRNNK